MEVSTIKNNGIRIKTKNGTIVIDPTSEMGDEDVLLYMSSADRFKSIKPKKENLLVIQGPGEYETRQVSLTGKEIKGEVMYTITSDSSRLLLLPSTLLDELEEDGEYSGVLVKATSPINDTIFSHAQGAIIMVYGDPDKIFLKAESLKTASKVNLKKKEEFEGSAVILS